MTSDNKIDTAACILERLNLRHETKSYPPEEILGDQQQNIFVFNTQRFGFDNRFRVHFTLLGRTFSSIEQYFIWQKARFFGDLEIATEVMIIDNPLTIRRIGKRIRGYNQEEWNSVRNKAFGPNSHKTRNYLTSYVPQEMDLLRRRPHQNYIGAMV
uniref:DUF1768 domain-containing protein n=1 Tax=Meloidogyne hapla TaxID=6305 RepID=A0A1I8B7E9_MELHA